MRVSVVIPTYNSGPLLVEALSSVLAQTTPPDEVIVVDDGSTDDTAQRMAEFADRVRYIRKENGGVSTARNRGMAEASGEYIAFLDADDVWHSKKLEIQLAELVARPDLGMLGTGTYLWPTARHPAIDPLIPLTVRVSSLADLAVKNAFVTSTVLVRREVLRKVGEFDTDQFGTEDYDLWLRIAQHVPVANIPVALTGYRRALPGSLSKNAVRMEAGKRIILRKLEAAGVFLGKPLLRRKAWGHFRYSCGYMHHQAGDRWTAAGHLAHSLLGYPFPYDRTEVRSSFGRIRLLTAAILKSGRQTARAS